MAADNSCNVCINTFNASTRKKITCPSCAYESCRQCTVTYFLGLTCMPKCMNCQTIFTSTFLMDNFTKTFVCKDLRKHGDTMVLKQEPALLQKIQLLTGYDKQTNEIDKQINVLTQQIEELNRIRQNIITQKWNYMHEINPDILEVDDFLQSGVMNDKKKEERVHQLYLPCPLPTCHGYTKNGKCGLCDMIVCKNCNEEEGNAETHVCSKEALETVAVIKATCKPCPWCSVPIHRIDGCYEMFCTNCNNAFDWGTGKKLAQPKHNPHYFDFLRKNSITVHEGCGAAAGLTGMLINSALRKREERAYLEHVLRKTIELEDVIDKRTNMGEFARKTNLLRYRYMTNTIKKEEYEKQIVTINHKHMYNVEMRDLIKVTSTSIADILRQIINKPEMQKDEIMILFDSIFVMFNEYSKNIAQFHSRKPVVYITQPHAYLPEYHYTLSNYRF